MTAHLLAALFVIAVAAVACDDSPNAGVDVRAKGAPAQQGGPVLTCTQAGERCKLPGNQLGICTAADYKSNDPDKSPEGPGFVCLSQH